MSEENKEEKIAEQQGIVVEKKEEIPKDNNKKSNKKKIIIIVSILLVLIIGGVSLFYVYKNSKDKSKTVKSETVKVTSEYKMTGNDLQNFDLRFLQLESNGKNMVYSPLSIKYALAMLSEGTKGNSKAQLDALIGDYKAKKYENTQNMSFANAMFIRTAFKEAVIEEYVNKIQEEFNAEVIYDEFENSDNINAWVSDKTFGLVNNLLDKNINDSQFYLINALAIDMEWNKVIQARMSRESDEKYSVSYHHERYFEGIEPIEEMYGTVKFNNRTIDSKAVEIGASINNYDIVETLGEENIRATISQEYTAWLEQGGCGDDLPVDEFVNNFIKELDSNYKRVDASTDFKFYDDESVKVFSKELKEYNGTTLEYIGIMPKDITLDEYIKNTSANKINETINKIKTVELDNFEKGKVTKIIGGIPLFKYEYELPIMDDLKKLGVTDIFTPKANLDSMVKDPTIVIDDVKHKANIEFSNEGIKAAAATSSGGMGASSCRFEHLYEVPVVTIDLTFDNPYLYLIRDKNSKEVWFVGTVYEPEINEVNEFYHSKIINE